MRRATVLATAVLALGALGAPAMAVAPDAVPDEGSASLARINGENRYDTAAKTAQRTHPDGADTVLVATGENFPDALAASYLAGRESVEAPAPILLTLPGTLPEHTRDALQALDAQRVVIVGETSAVSARVAGQIGDVVGDANVNRIGGDDRIQTAAMIARRAGDVGTMGDLSADDGTQLRTAVVARADRFPDALAAGPLALEGRHPILLTDPGTLPQATIDALTDPDLGIEQVVLTGGPMAITEDVEAQIAGLDSITNVERVWGEVRTETAVRLAELTRSSLGWSAQTLSLARGENFPDALTLAPLAAMRDASLYLTVTPNSLGGDTFAGIQDVCDQVERVLISGGPAAVSHDTAGEAKQATLCATYEFPISAEQSVDAEGEPTGKSGAEGTGWVAVVGDTICTAYDVDGLEGQATDSHIHRAPEGQTGDPVLPLGAPDANGFLTTCEDDAELAVALTTQPQDHYVNIHTPQFPQSAARGQLVQSSEGQQPSLPATEFMVFGDAVRGDTGQADLVGDAILSTNAQGQLCLRLEGVDAATAAQLFEGAVDQTAGEGDLVASFDDVTSGRTCTTAEDPAALLGSGDRLYLSVDDATGDEIARGQVEATQAATLQDGNTEVGNAYLYRAANSNELCVAVDVGELRLDAAGNLVVTAGDTIIATYTGLDDAIDYACDVEADAADGELITVPVTGDAEGDGELSGDFGTAV